MVWRRASPPRRRKRIEDALQQPLSALTDRLLEGAPFIVEQMGPPARPVTPEELAPVAARPELRRWTYNTCRNLGQLHLFPAHLATTAAQAEGDLANWVALRTGRPPEALERVTSVQRLLDGRLAELHVLRFRERGAWALGVTGPYFPGDEPYASEPTSFSWRGEAEQRTPPGELVDRFVERLRRKGKIKAIGSPGAPRATA